MLATAPDGRTTAYPLQPNFVAAGANCYASNHDPKEWYVACLWPLGAATASAADDEVRSASHQLSACLGSGYLERPSLPGGFLFFETPTEDEAIITEAVVDGRYKLIVQVLGPGIRLQ